MADSWESHKETLRMLYLVKDQSLKKVMLHMRDQHEFAKSKGQYERQFKKWGFRKNSTSDGWKVIHRIIDKRGRHGKASKVILEGKVVPEAKIKKEKRHDFGDPLELYRTAPSPKMPEGFVVCTPRDDATPSIFIGNIPTLQLFQNLRSLVFPAQVSVASTFHDMQIPRGRILSNLTQASTLREAQESSQSSYAISSANSYDQPNGLTSISREDSVQNICPRLDLTPLAQLTSNSGLLPRETLHEICPDRRLQSLLSMIYMSCNNLLDRWQASDAWKLIGKNNNRAVFTAFISGQSPAAKAIARTFLPVAIEASDIAIVRMLLDTGVDPNSPLGYGRGKPLSIASRKGDLEIMRYLLDCGAELNAADGSWQTALTVAVIAGQMEAVKLLLRCGADVNLPVAHSISPLGYAVSKEMPELVEMLLVHRADPNRRCNEGLWLERYDKSPLEIAASQGNLELVQLLLRHDADMHDRCENDDFKLTTALHQAISSGNPPVIQLLLDSGADATEALPYAVRSGDLKLMQQLVGLGADVEAYSHETCETTCGAMTALQKAAALGKHAIVRFLLNSGAAINAPADADHGMTALQAAAKSGDRELAQMLLGFGAEVNAVPAAYAGRTALQAAIESGSIDIFRCLMERGADINGPPAVRYGITALEAAASSDNSELMKLLLDTDIDLRVQGGPSIARAIRFECFATLELLLSSGADVNDTYIDWDQEYHYSALELAVVQFRKTLTYKDPFKMVKLLLDHGADDKSKALLLAAGGHFEAAKLLLSSGANVNVAPEDGTDWTVLSIAASTGNLDLVRLFHDHGAQGTSVALQVAANNGFADVLQFLLSVEADTNAPPANLFFSPQNGVFASTALQAAADTGRLDIVRLLLDAGARPEADPSPYEHGTALQLAAMRGHIDIVRELLQRDADVNAAARGDYGRTALEGAAEHGRLDITQLLLNAQAETRGSRALKFARQEGHDGVVQLLLEHLN